MLLLSALLLAGPAAAADLDLTLSVDDVVLAELTVRDIEQAMLPPLLVPASDVDCPRGHPDLLVGLVLTPVDDGARWRIEAVLEELRPDRRGRLTREEVSRPVITTSLGEPATLTQGSRVPIMDGDEVQWEEHAFTLEARISE